MELKDYFSVTPAFRSIYNDINYDYNDIQSSNVKKAYISEEENKLGIEDIKKILLENNLLIKPDQSIAKPFQPGSEEKKF